MKGHSSDQKPLITQSFLDPLKFTNLLIKMALRLAVVVAAGLALTLATLIPPIEIAPGFEFLGTAEGKIFTRPIYGNNSDDLTYQEAISKCVSAGYKIATIESAAQNAAVENHTCTDFRWSWIDGVDFILPDVFISINTGRNLTYFNWSKWGQRPILWKDDRNRNCIRISCNNVEGAAWWDVLCTDKLSVICEAPL